MIRLSLALFVGTLLFLVKPGVEAGRGMLWRVVQACVANHDLTGFAFPCLEVETAPRRDQGYVVLRAPFAKSHAILTPTVRTVGIEAPSLRGPDAPNYFADAWASRRYATDELKREPNRADLALAVNSRAGRSQDQFHIHIDCIRPKVKAALAREVGRIAAGRWTHMPVTQDTPFYWATAVAGETLMGVNVLDLVAEGLKVAPAAMADVTVIVVGSDAVGGKPGFIVLARKRLTPSYDEAHGEALMDHSCSAFR